MILSEFRHIVIDLLDVLVCLIARLWINVYRKLNASIVRSFWESRQIRQFQAKLSTMYYSVKIKKVLLAFGRPKNVKVLNSTSFLFWRQILKKFAHFSREGVLILIVLYHNWILFMFQDFVGVEMMILCQIDGAWQICFWGDRLVVLVATAHSF